MIELDDSDEFGWHEFLMGRVAQLSERGAVLFALVCCNRLRKAFDDHFPKSIWVAESMRLASDFLKGSFPDETKVASLLRAKDQYEPVSPNDDPHAVGAARHCVGRLLASLANICEGELERLPGTASGAGSFAEPKEGVYCVPGNSVVVRRDGMHFIQAEYLRAQDDSRVEEPPGEMKVQLDIIDDIYKTHPRGEIVGGQPFDPADFVEKWKSGEMDWSNVFGE